MLQPRRVLALSLVVLCPSLACKADGQASDQKSNDQKSSDQKSSDQKSDDQAEQAPKLETIDISSIDPALTGKLKIDAPAGSQMHPAGPGNVMITGPQKEVFEVLVSTEPRDLDIWREKPEEIVLDEPDLVVFSVKVGERGMLGFSANVTVGERVFGCIPDTEGFLERSHMDVMIAACRSLRIE